MVLHTTSAASKAAVICDIGLAGGSTFSSEGLLRRAVSLVVAKGERLGWQDRRSLFVIVRSPAPPTSHCRLGAGRVQSLFSVLMLAQTDVMVSATEQTANPCDHVYSVACTSLSKIASEEIMIRPKIGPFILLMN